MPKKNTRRKSSAKRSRRKAGVRSHRRKVKKRRDPLVFLGVLALILVLAAIGAYLLSSAPSVTKGQASNETSEVLVTVNGRPITRAELDFQYNLLPAPLKASLTKEMVLEQVINEALVVQASEEKGVRVSQEDVQKRIQGILKSGGVSLADLQKNLAFYNESIEDFEKLVKRQIIIESFTKENIKVPEPTEENLRLIYESRMKDFTTDDQVKVRHVLVSNQRADAAVIAKKVYDSARNGDDFCGLVKQYSDDKGSRDSCGEYVFPKGRMVPEFEQASFSMKPGEFRLVQTVFGYHVIEKLEDVPAGTKSFDEVKDALVGAYYSAERARQYQLLLDDLRKEAVIVYAGESRETPEKERALGNESQEEENQEILQEKEVLQEGNESVPVVEPPVQTANAKVTIERPPVECIASKAVLYGASWSTESEQQRALVPGVTYVECDKEPQKCMSAGVKAYPTWGIHGRLSMGSMTLKELARETGC